MSEVDVFSLRSAYELFLSTCTGCKEAWNLKTALPWCRENVKKNRRHFVVQNNSFDPKIKLPCFLNTKCTQSKNLNYILFRNIQTNVKLSTCCYSFLFFCTDSEFFLFLQSANDSGVLLYVIRFQENPTQSRYEFG